MSNFRERLVDSHADYVDGSSSTRGWRAASINSASPSPPVRSFHGYTDDEDERDTAAGGDVYDDDGEHTTDTTLESKSTSEAPLSPFLSTSFPGDPHKAPKQLRYTCWGARKGCMMSHPQWITSILLIVSGVLLVVLLVVFLGIVPSIIASSVASAGVHMGPVSISQPDSSARTLHLNSSLFITNAGSFAAHLHEMQVSISHLLADGSTYSASMGTVTVPDMTLSGDTEVALNTVMQVGDEAAFDSFVQRLIAEKSVTVTWHLSASASITPVLGSLTLPTYSSIAFEKDVMVAGCDGLQQTWVESFSLASSNATSANIDLLISVWNPSSFSISPLGRLHFLVTYEGQYIGDVYSVKEEPLVPGNNSLQMQGSLIQTTAAAEHDLIQLYLTGQPAAVIATAASDASSIPLFNAGLQGLNLSTTVPGNQLNLVRTMTFQSMRLVPSASDLTAAIDVGLVVTINSPLGPNSPLQLQTMSIDSVLMYLGQPVGELVSGVAAVTPVYTGNATATDTFTANLTGQLRLLGDGGVYEQFVAQLVPATSLKVTVTGTTNITTQYVLGNLSATALPVTAESTLPGLQSLAPVVEAALNITGEVQCDTPPCGLTVSMAASLYNPSFVTVALNNSGLTLHYKGDLLGRLEAPVLNINPGVNFITLPGQLWPNADTATVSEFIDDFIHGKLVHVQLLGDASDESNSSASALTTAALRLNASVPGQDCAASLIESIVLSNFSIDFHNGSAYVSSAAVSSFALPDNLAMSLSISQLDMQATVWLNATASMGQLAIHNLPVVYHHRPHPPDLLDLVLNQAELRVDADQMAGFIAFANDLLLSTSASFTLAASATPTADTPLGALTLSDIPATSTTTFSGLNRFLSHTGESLIRILAFDIVETAPAWMLVVTNISITNPSNVSLHSLGTLRLDLRFNSSLIGTVSLPSFALPRGEMNHTAIANISRPTGATQASLDSFIGSMINQTSSSVTLHGGLEQLNGSIVPGTDITLLQPTITSFVSQSIFPGLRDPFIEFFNSTLALINIPKAIMPSSIRIHNPFSAYISMEAVNISVWATQRPGLELGYWIQDLRVGNKQIVFSPHSNETSPVVDITLKLLVKELFCEVCEMLDDRGILPVNTEGWIRTDIRNTREDKGEGFEQVVHIDSRDVPCFITFEIFAEDGLAQAEEAMAPKDRCKLVC